ncbi:peptidoglycan-binding protein [Phormidium sp. CLA17]|uniref:peptidoglycan-binding protein n=1 Tax=Leptolyngbya sp. Cla-17 TaxID=2803751 RepID=UPI001491003D|nr:peptidoglycan-binding protein [Leptolyngbya sp. Cla-17]MBM0741878.1 peptidoglycan-binding protein [Leptolyngbya sp. Cla-17]
MELLAFVHTAVNYEDSAPDPEVTVLDRECIKASGSALMTLAGAAVVAVSVGSGNAMASTASYSAGASGDEVTHIQKALGIEADGAYGAKTEASVMDFQVRQGLKQVDGIVGKETATALGLDEKYKPVDLGVVDTYSGIGLNVRSGPGLDYRRIGGLADGTVVDTYGQVVSYDHYGYSWQREAGGGWVATDYVSDYYEPTSYEEVSYHHDHYHDHHHSDEYYDDGYYSPVSYTHGGGYVGTNTGIGLNIRSGPGLGYGVEGAVSDGTYLPTVNGTVYQDGYDWEELPDGNWVASNYLE